MLSLLRDLVAHKGHADAAVLEAVGGTEPSASDQQILDLLHHILIANRFWICAVRRVPFIGVGDAGGARDLMSLREIFKATHEEEMTWLGLATEENCAARLNDPLIPGGGCSVGEALTQVCMHSHAHRIQIAKLLRQHGVVPPQTDFILWLSERRPPEWGQLKE